MPQLRSLPDLATWPSRMAINWATRALCAREALAKSPPLGAFTTPQDGRTTTSGVPTCPREKEAGFAR